ncbi:Clp protease ClpA, partial [Escherichia coli]|nr:Clp protease ClpA [Escherichia coli]
LALPAEWMMVTMIISVVLILFGTVLLAVKVGQGGSRLKFADQPDGVNKPIRDDDSFWKAGVIYFNRNDPALFVEKRFGIG